MDLSLRRASALNFLFSVYVFGMFPFFFSNTPPSTTAGRWVVMGIKTARRSYHVPNGDKARNIGYPNIYLLSFFRYGRYRLLLNEKERRQKMKKERVKKKERRKGRIPNIFTRRLLTTRCVLFLCVSNLN